MVKQIHIYATTQTLTYIYIYIIDPALILSLLASIFLY